MIEIMVADIGGTHARFAIAKLDGTRVVSLSAEKMLAAAQHDGLDAAWRAYRAQLDRPSPRWACIAVAAPIHGDTLKLTNNPWIIRPHLLAQELGLEGVAVVNDFAAIGHAVAQVDATYLRDLIGPAGPLPAEGVISVIGPGTGLGVAQIIRREDDYQVISTEGGHIAFAPLDSQDEEILSHLRERYARVSTERVCSGPGLANLYAALAAATAQPASIHDDKTLWAAALGGGDALASAALERFCLSFGSFAGDIALAHGADAVVLAGSLSQRLADQLVRLGFSRRFNAKARFEPLMASLSVKLLNHPQPGLLGAAAAYAKSGLRANRIRPRSH